MLLEKVWGGSRLARFGKGVAAGAKIGESWEVADLGATSASGAGGGAAISVIANGPLAGKTLRDAIKLWGPRLIGTARLANGGRGKGDGSFPLLVKFLDASENLSVQVHPSPGYLAAHPGEGAHLKTECWYILAAEPGSVIYKGVKGGVTRASFEKHLRTGDGSPVVGDLVAVRAVPGECHNLPSGTVHALGAGVLVAEVQTPSDTTFRIYDWGRTGRELHTKQALQCIDFENAAPPPRWLDADAMRGVVARNEFFTVIEMRAGAAEANDEPIRLSQSKACIVVVVLEGRGELLTDGHGSLMNVPAMSVSGINVSAGGTVVVPAELTCRFEMRPLTAMRWLVVELDGR